MTVQSGMGLPHSKTSRTRWCDSLFAISIMHKPGCLAMGDAIEPGAKCLRNLKRFQSPKCVEPNLLMQVERVVGVRDGRRR